MLHRLAESFPWLRAAADYARLTVFLGFAALGLRIVWLETQRKETRRAIIHCIVYALAASCFTGFTQIEAWPFTTWALVHNISHTEMLDWKLEAVTASGQAYAVDPRFIQPLPYEDFDTWLKQRFLALGLTEEEIRTNSGTPHAITPEQARVADFLVARIEQARVRFRSGRSPGTSSWLLGPLSAPYHFDRPAVWRSAADTPDVPFVGLRIWELKWDIEERYRDESRVQRRLIFHYRS